MTVDEDNFYTDGESSLKYSGHIASFLMTFTLNMLMLILVADDAGADNDDKT